MQLNKSITTKLKTLEKQLSKKRFLTNEEQIIENLNKLFLNATKKRATDEFGIAFSGGIDSSLIALLCSKLNKKFKLYTVGLQNSQDLEWAEKIAFKMKWPIKFKIITLTEAEKVIKQVKKIIPKKDPVNVGIAATLFSTLSLAKEDEVKLILTGLGSEEIFAGYERYKINIHKACWSGLIDIYKRDLTRDLSVSRFFNIKLACPFLDKEIITYSMQISPKLKIKNNHKKFILRETAQKLGLPKQFAFRKKKAAQYGSGFDKAIEKLAKKSGFKYKKDYLKNLS